MDSGVMTPPLSRGRKRASEEQQKQRKKDVETPKRFRSATEAGPTSDGEVKELKSEFKEEMEEQSAENGERGVTSENHLQASGEGPSSQFGRASTATNPTVLRSLEELKNIVFGSDEAGMLEIRERIIGHVIRSEINRGSSRSDLRSVRLVTKEWLQMANKCVLKCGELLYRIKLTPQTSMNSSPVVQRNGKLLDQVTSSLTTAATYLKEKIPLFSLKICPDFFRVENHQSFFDFLAKCSSGLADLELCIPKNCGSMTFLFPGLKVAFPNLHTFTVAFSAKPIQLFGNEAVLSSGSNEASLHLIQQILSGTKSLEALQFLNILGQQSHIPLGIRYLILPPTITILNLGSFMKTSELESLLNFDLPLLHTLEFYIFLDSCANGVASLVLEKFRLSLRTLRIQEGRRFMPPPARIPIFVEFPVMEKLESLFICNQFIRLSGAGDRPLQNYLPNLRELSIVTFCKLTTDQIRKWTESTNLPKVTHLSLLTTGTDDFGQLSDLNLSCHFPNLRTLCLSSRKTAKTAFLIQIFQKLPKLKELKLRIKVPPENGGSEDWDSILTGIPVESVGGVRINPKSWQNTQLKYQRLPSIKNLGELECLELRSCPSPSGESPISNLAFHFGFLEMPKLKVLTLGGGFKASPQIAAVWKSHPERVLRDA